MPHRPNILFITSDQQHYDTLGFANPRIQTPALDRLAREGTNFTRAYCPNPVCSPSRSSIITGMYPSLHHCWTIGVKLPEDMPTVGEALHDEGYMTSLIGKAHFQPLASRPGSESIECQPILRDLNYWRQFHGPWYGFRHVETARMHTDESHVGQHYAIWLEEHGLKDWADYFYDVSGKPGPKALKTDPGIVGGREPGAWPLPAELHYTTWIAERTIANMKAAVERGQPFFCWSSHPDPHPPYAVPDPWASMYDPADMPIGQYVSGEFDPMPPTYAMTRDPKADWSQFHNEPGGHHAHGCHSHLHDEALLRRSMATYYGMISFMDQQIGRTLDALDELGVADNTIVVFTTDHGHFLGQHGLMAKGPFHYEDLIRLPFLVRWPGRVAAGASSDAIQSLVDLAPTFIDAAGGEIPGWMQGLSQVPTWTAETGNADAPHVRDHAIVENRHNPTRVHLRTFVNKRYKLTLYRDRDWGELFDLQDDPHELRNRFNDPNYAAVKADLLRQFMNAEIKREPTRMPRIAGA